MVACTAPMFEQLQSEQRRGTLLVQGQDAAVHGLQTLTLNPNPNPNPNQAALEGTPGPASRAVAAAVADAASQVSRPTSAVGGSAVGGSAFEGQSGAPQPGARARV